MFDRELKRLLAELKPKGSRIFSEILVKNNINLVGITPEQRQVVLQGMSAALDARNG